MNPYGIVWESEGRHPNPGNPEARWGGMVVFETTEQRREACELLREVFGPRVYAITFRDVNGYGLSWSEWCGRTRVRPEARDRLPSVQRAHLAERAFRYSRTGLYRNPGYDLIHDPYPNR